MTAQSETVGSFTFTVAFREPAPDARERFDQRADMLAAWLLAQWLCERKETDHDERD